MALWQSSDAAERMLAALVATVQLRRSDRKLLNRLRNKRQISCELDIKKVQTFGCWESPLRFLGYFVHVVVPPGSLIAEYIVISNDFPSDCANTFEK
jgi:hypothetical protein